MFTFDCSFLCLEPLFYFIVSFNSTYQVTLTALEEMFQAARGIMTWLGDCAKVCCFIFLVVSYLDDMDD